MAKEQNKVTSKPREIINETGASKKSTVDTKAVNPFIQKAETKEQKKETK